MATILSAELLSYISPVLMFIFIFAILYSVLQKFESFGKNQPINAAISFAGALLFLIVPLMRDFVTGVIPWLVIMILVIVVILMILMFMGYKETDIVSYMKENSFGAVITTIVVLIFLIVLAKVVGPSFLQYPTPAEAGITSNIKRVLFNPKVLGVIFVLVVAAYFMKAIAIPIREIKK